MHLTDKPEIAFAEPWHAALFAMTHSLATEGRFDWNDWSAHFSTALKTANDRGAPDDGSTYYEIWLAALEEFLIDRRLAQALELAELKQEWTDVYLATPHGRPVALSRHRSGRL